MVYLKDGLVLGVRYQSAASDTRLTFSEVDHWEAGRPLVLAFSSLSGLILVDVTTGKELPVVSGFAERHPLDVALKRAIENDGSTMGMQAAFDRSTEHWAGEIARLKRRLEDVQQLPVKHSLRVVARQLRHAQGKWEAFRELHRLACSNLYGSFAGTASIIDAASNQHGVVRERALQLGSEVAALDELVDSE